MGPIVPCRPARAGDAVGCRDAADRPRRRAEGHWLLERGPAGGAPQGPEDGPAGDEHEHPGRDRPTDVPAEAGGQR